MTSNSVQNLSWTSFLLSKRIVYNHCRLLLNCLFLQYRMFMVVFEQFNQSRAITRLSQNAIFFEWYNVLMCRLLVCKNFNSNRNCCSTWRKAVNCTSSTIYWRLTSVYLDFGFFIFWSLISLLSCIYIVYVMDAMKYSTCFWKNLIDFSSSIERFSVQSIIACLNTVLCI